MSLQTVSHFRIEGLLGAGGMGEVYLAEDLRLHRKVALKLLPARFTEDDERVRRFQREARAASALSHPNIITIYEIGVHDSVHFIATELVDGETIREKIIRGPMPLTQVIDIGMGVANALAAAHEAGIVHRDIKPDNVMLRGDGLVKVLDFGLAKLTDDRGAIPVESQPGTMMGTLLYISPEQARGIAPDARSDIFSLGVVLYEMLTGRTPFLGDNLLDVITAIATKDAQPPSQLVPGISPDLERIVLKALVKNRDERYQSARELLADLRTLREEADFAQRYSQITGQQQRLYGQHNSALQMTAPLSFPPTEPLPLVDRVRAAKWSIAGLLLACLFLAAAGYALFRNYANERPIDSIAVLPFTNLSGDATNEYLSDGLSESITDSLSQLPNVQVMARSTVFRYKGKSVDPLQVGRELQVRGVVTGQVLQHGDTLVIRAALTDVKKGTQVWGEHYDRRMSDILAVQEEMASEISDKLRTKITGEEKRRLTKRGTDNTEAFQLYLKGRYYINLYDEQSTRKAISFFNEAIHKDPSYALAYAGLADAYFAMSNLFSDPSEAMPRAHEAAQRALEIDETLAEAHTSLAVVLVWYDWDFVQGEAQFRRAIQLNGNYPTAHRLYGDFLTAMGRYDEALLEKKRSVKLDPLSPLAIVDLARTHFFNGNLDEAMALTNEAIELDSRFVGSYVLRCWIAQRRGRYDLALAEIHHAMQLAGRTPLLVGMEGFVNASAGNRAAAMTAISELKKNSEGQKHYTLPLLIARIDAGLGDAKEATAELEKSYADRSESMVWLRVDPSFDTIRKTPQFSALLAKVTTTH
jgi:serine/threonine-protein kinase